MNWDIRRAELKDIPLIAELADKIWKQHYPSIISSEQISYMLQRFYSPVALTQQMKDGHRFWLISTDDVLCGYLSESCPDPGHYFLHKFYIDPAVQGKGLGKLVFDKIFSEKKDLQTLRLTVNRMNYKSVNFYFRLGFIIEKITDIDIGDSYFMNDFIMLYQPGTAKKSSFTFSASQHGG